MAEIINFSNLVNTPKEVDIKEVLSTKPTLLSDLVGVANEIYENSTDYMVRKATTQNIRFNENAGFTFLTEMGEKVESEISRFALSQMSTKLGIPSRYIEKCVSNGLIDLAQENVNTWLDEYQKDLFIREYNGRIRGVLSSKYSVCDSHDILKVLEDVVNLDDYKIKGSFLNEERLHLRLISNEMLPIDNEDLFAGIYVDSSDVGRNVLSVRFGIYKQVCTNGLVVARAGGKLFEQKHIGITAEEFYEGLVASLKNIDILKENAIEWVQFAREKMAFKDIGLSDTEAFIEKLRSKTNLSEESANKVIQLMTDTYDESRWGLVNSITEVAQEFTLEKRLELEKIAGDLLIA